MKIKTKDLSGVALDWAVGTIDPQCEGLTFGIEKEMLCGYTIEENGEKSICIYLVGGAFNKTIKAKKILGFNYAESYSPTTNGGSASRIVENNKISVNWDDSEKKWFTVDKATEGETFMIAALRYFVWSKYGEEIEVPEDFKL